MYEREIPLVPLPGGSELGDEVEIEVEGAADPSLDVEIIVGPDGVVTIAGSAEDGMRWPEDHDANLAEVMTEDELRAIGMDVVDWVRIDEASREKWKESYVKQMTLLALEVQERRKEPFDGACNYIHPMALEALVRFQSQTIKAVFPAGGPVKSKIIGAVTPEKQAQSDRAAGFMNWDLTEREQEYRADTEKLLWVTGAAGTAFRKTMVVDDEVSSRFVRPEDVLLPYAAVSIRRASRITEKVHFENVEQVEALQASGFYRQIPVEESRPGDDPVAEKRDKINRLDDTGEDRGVVLYECSCYLAIEDKVKRYPYIVTCDERGGVLAIRRNWEADDEKRRRLQWITQYDYIPGDGPYAYGILHVMGGSATAATGLLRQIYDAGTFSNMPGGFKSADAKTTVKTSVIQPGVFKDIEGVGVDLAKAFYIPPFREPSAVSSALLDKLVETGQRIGSIADVDVAEIGSQAPVGTTLALMDRAQLVTSAVEARIHASLSEEFRIRARLYKRLLPDGYAYKPEEEAAIVNASDFDDRIDVVPVSDPNASTRAQRLTAFQTAIQLSGMAPQVYDLPVLHRAMLRECGMQDVDAIVPDKASAQPMDPVSECMALLSGKPVKAYEWQNHQAHLTVLLNLKQSPDTAKYIGQSVNANTIAAAIDSAIADRYAYLWREQIQQSLGAPLPAPGTALPGEVEAHLSEAMAAASLKVIDKQKREAAQQQAAAAAQDPLVQIQQQELELKRLKLQLDLESMQEQIAQRREQAAAREQTERMRIESQERMSAEKSIDAGEETLATLRIERDRMAKDLEKATAEIALLQAQTKKVQAETIKTASEVGGDEDIG